MVNLHSLFLLHELCGTSGLRSFLLLHWLFALIYVFPFAFSQVGYYARLYDCLVKVNNPLNSDPILAF